MEYRKTIIILMVAIFIFSITAVSASDTNETLMTSIDDSQVVLSQNNKEIKQEEKDKVATASQSQRAVVSSEDAFANLSQKYGEERAVNALQGVNDYIDKLYPLFRKKKHPSISKKDRVLFAERLLNCANQTDLTDEDILYVIETALKNEKRGDPTILLVTTPSFLGYWIAMDEDFGFSHIKGTDYEFGEGEYKFCFW